MIHVLFSTSKDTKETVIYLINKSEDISEADFERYVSINVVGVPDLFLAFNGERILYEADNELFVNRGVIYTTASKKSYCDFLEMFKDVLSVPPLDKCS